MTVPFANAVVQATLKWDNLDDELERKVRLAADRAAKAAQKHLDRIRLAANVDLDADTAEFRRVTQERLDKAILSAHVNLRADTAKFHADVRAAVASLGKVKLDLDLDAGQIQPFVQGIEARLRAARITAPVFLEVANEAAFRAHIEYLTRPVTKHVIIRTIGGGPGGGGGGVGGIASGLLSMTNLAGIARVAMMALAAVSLVPLIGQLAQAAGTLSLLPAVAASAAAGIATIVIGSTGILDAFKAGSKAAEFTDGSAKAARQQEADARKRASAAKAVASAERGVGNAVDGVSRAERGVVQAQRDSEKAQKSLNQAREDAKATIDDLNFALKGTAIDERDAVLSLARAREAYDKTFADPAASALDRSEAALNVDKALRRQEEVGRRNTQLAKDAAEANRKGIEGSDKVIDAKTAVAEADQGIADAAKAVIDAQQQLADSQQNLIDAQTAEVEATEATTTAADEYADALANLSPKARAFVEQVRDLSDRWKEFRLQVQDNLFDGLGDSISSLADTYFPILTTGLGGIATEINGGLRRALADLQTDSVKLDWTTILENTRLAIGPVMDGLTNLFAAMTNIASIGSEFLPGFGKSFSETMKEFRDWTDSDAGREKIRTFMQNSITALGQIKDLFVEVGRVVGGLFTTSDEAGKSMVQSLTDTMREFADWMRTAEGQEKMRKFWEDVRSTVSDILNLVKEAVKLADKLMPIVAGVAGVLPRSVPAPGTPERADFDKNQQQARADSWRGTADRIHNGDASWNSQLWEQAQYFMGGFQNSDGSRAIPGSGALTRWVNRLFGAGDKDGYAYGSGPRDDQQPKAPTTVTVPSGGGRSAGKKLTREDWVALFGDAEEFDRILADQAEKNRQHLADSEQTYVTFGERVTGILDGLTGGTFSRFTTGLSNVAKSILGTTEDGQINWGNLGSKIGEVATNVVDTVFPGFKLGLGNLKEFAFGVVEGFGGDWSRLKEFAAGPINWIIDNVINGALKSAWNAVAAVIPGLKPWDGVARIESDPLAGKRSDSGGTPVGQHYAKGGIHGIMPGYTPGRDPYTIGVSGGEAIMRPEWTRAIGPAYIHGMNAAARTEGVDGVRRRMQYFASGGIVQPGAEITTGIQQSMWDAVRTAFPNAVLTSGTRYEDVGSGFDNHMGQRAIDLGGPMPDIARWIYDLNQTQPVLELIHAPLDGWENLKNGSPLNYGAGTDADHLNHVHWAMDSMVSSDGKVVSSSGGRGILSRIAGAVVNPARRAAANAFQKAVGTIGQSIPDFGGSLMGSLPRAAFEGVTGALTNWIRGSSGSSGGSGPNADWLPSGGAEQWRQMMIDAYRNQGYEPTPEKINAWVRQIDTEAGGDPNIAQQIVDVNGTGEAAGVGLGQMIPSTWQAYRDPSLPDNRRDPWAMTNAMVRYGEQKYGASLLDVIGHGHGYDLGGIANGIGLLPKFTIQPERVLSPEMTADFERLVKVLERPDFIDVLRQMNNVADAAAVVPSTDLSAVAGAAAKSTAFDPNNRGYDQSYYNDPVPRGGIDGANAWLARQDFGPQIRTWGINAVKEIGGEFADTIGLKSAWGGLVDREASEATKWRNANGGDVIINNEFHGYQGTPQSMIAEWERVARQGMSTLTETFRKG